MKSFLRSWRVWWLALALVAAPQLSFVHALTHVASASQAGSSDHERQQAPDKACDLCLSFAHLAQALTTQHAWQALDSSSIEAGAVRVAHAEQRPPAHFNARAPPHSL